MADPVRIEGLASRRAVAAGLWRRRAVGARELTAAVPPAQPVCPLSFAQERMWCLEQLRPDASPYAGIDARLVEGELDPRLLEASLNEIVRRHDLLRTVIQDRADGPVQTVLPAVRIDVPVVDLAALTEGDRFAWLRRLAQDEGRTRFDLARGPLLRVRLFRLGPTRHVVWIVAHHSVADGWSSAILEYELESIYAAFSRGAPSPLPPPPVQYRQFALWQRSATSDATIERQLRHWRNVLRGAPPSTALPAPQSAPSSTSPAAQEPVVLDRAARARLEEAATCAGVTPFVVLLAVLSGVLAAATGQRDLVFGTPISERPSSLFDDVIGCFLNTLPLRVDVGGEPSWRELIARAQRAVLAMHAGRSVPFQRLLHDLRPGAPSLFNVWITLVDAPRRPGPPVLQPWRALDFGGGVPQFDLALVMFARDDEVSGFVEYDRRAVAAPVVQYVAAELQAQLSRLPASFDAPALGVSPAGAGAAAVPTFVF